MRKRGFRKSKRGISQTVSTILLVLLIVAVIAVIWTIIIRFIETSRLDISSVGLTIVEDQVYMNATDIAVAIRKTGTGHLAGIKFIFQNASNYEYTYIDYMPEGEEFKELETRTFVIPLSDKISNVTKVSVAPVFIKEEKEEIGPIQDETEEPPQQNDTLPKRTGGGGGGGGAPTPPPNQAPTAYNQTISIRINTPTNITLTATDPENNPLTFTIQAYPTNGSLNETHNPIILYTPNLSFTGPDSFTFKANDGSADSNIATISINVVENLPPIAEAGDDKTIFLGESVLLNGSESSDPDGSIVLYEWDFTTDGIYDYSGIDPNTTTSYNIAGNYTVTLRVTDNEGAQDTDTLNITVNEPVTCTTDADCDDGLYCTGVETCNLGSGLCESGTPPSCDDGDSCTQDFCNVATDSCEHVYICCDLTSAYWNQLTAIEGEVVGLTVTGDSNCEGKTIDFEVWEWDGVSNDPVVTNPVSAVFSGGIATSTWTAEWQDDWPNIPEYYFVATVAGEDTIDSGADHLIVYQCSDGDEDGYYDETDNCPIGTDCDDTNPTINPGAAEICGDDTDNNCDGNIDEGCICTLTSAYWSPGGEVANNTFVQMIVQGTNCDGKQINFTVYENDPIVDDLVTSMESSYDRTTWTALWTYPGDDDIGSDPRDYYFVAFPVENPSSTTQSDILSVNSTNIGATLNLLNFSTNTNSPGKYEKYEISFKIDDGTGNPETYTNPFDPDEIDIMGHFINLDNGETFDVPGFWYQEYSGTDSANLNPVGSPMWKIRFAPNEVGNNWQYYITATDSSGTRTSATYSFNVQDSTNSGFIRVSSANPNYFEFDNGEAFFGVGPNIGWADGASDKITHYQQFISALANYGGNFYRQWMENNGASNDYDYGPIRIQYGTLGGNYNLADAWSFDQNLELAEQNDVYIMLTLGSYHRISDEWDLSIYNAANGGPCTTKMCVFNDPWSRESYQRLLRYLIARYGYSTSIFSWAFWNEINEAEWNGPSDWDWGQVIDWHNDMAVYTKSIDPYDHIISTSTGSFNPFSDLYGLDSMEYAQIHGYYVPGWPHHPSSRLGRDMANFIRYYAEKLIASVGNNPKPHIHGEFGLRNSGWGISEYLDGTAPDDFTGIHLHNGIWGGLMSGLATTPQSFEWHYFDPPSDYGYPDYFEHHRALGNYVADIGLNTKNFITLDSDEHPLPNPGFEDGINNWGLWPNDGTVAIDSTFRYSGANSLKYEYIPGIPSETYQINKHYYDMIEGGDPFVLLPNRQYRLSVMVNTAGLTGGSAYLETSFGDTSTPISVTNGWEQLVLDFTTPSSVEIYTLGIRVSGQGTAWFDDFQIMPVEKPEVDNANLRVLGLIADDGSEAYLWLQNKEYTWYNVVVNGITPTPISAAQITIPNMNAGDYNIEWWDTYTGEIIGTSGPYTVTDGSLVFSVGDIAWDTTKDVAVKIRPVGGVPCSNECSSGQTRCNGDYLQTCGDYDADECLEWGGDDDCSDCSCTCGNYGLADEVGYCSDGKDNDCDGLTDREDLDCEAVPSNLILWLEFNDDISDGIAYDSSGNNNHGSCSGNGCPTYTADGKIGDAYDFDGVDDYITTPDLNLVTDNFTWAGWIKLNAINREHVLMSEDSWTNYIRVIYSDGVSRVQAKLNIGGTGYIITPSNILSADTWHHIAVTYDGSNMIIYIEGINSGSRSATGNIDTIDAVQIGAMIGGGIYAEGIIDDIRIYNRALSQTEIQALMSP